MVFICKDCGARVYTAIDWPGEQPTLCAPCEWIGSSTLSEAERQKLRARLRPNLDDPGGGDRVEPGEEGVAGEGEQLMRKHAC